MRVQGRHHLAEQADVDAHGVMQQAGWVVSEEGSCLVQGDKQFAEQSVAFVDAGRVWENDGGWFKRELEWGWRVGDDLFHGEAPNVLKELPSASSHGFGWQSCAG